MLQRRRNTFTSRVVVPSDLRDTIGRAEITRSLRTGDPRQAARRQALWETHLGTYFATIRTRGRAMSREQLDAITRRYLEATFDEIEERLALDWRNTGAARDERQWRLQEDGQRLTALLAQADPAEFLQEAQRLLPEADETTQRKLARRLIEARLEGIDAELDAWSGRPLARPLPERSQEESPGIPKETPRVSEVAQLYGNERVTGRKWSPKTELQNRTILAWIAELLGDPQIGAVTKADIRELGQTIPRLPSNLSKRFPGVALRDVLEKTAGVNGVARLEPRSINKYYQLARSLFAWAHEHDQISQNPATVLKDVKERRAREDRLPFTDDDLRSYFAVLDKYPERPEMYWIPRIMAYSGLRLNEAAQLMKSDIREHDGVLVFDVNENAGGKRLKTSASRRLVPVHSRLLAMGLMEFVKGRPGEYLIDGRWRTNKNPTRGDIDALSKLLNRMLRGAGITDKRKTGAHSFRHTVSARLKRASVPEYQIAELLGHENESITTGRYGETTDISALAEALANLHLDI